MRKTSQNHPSQPTVGLRSLNRVVRAVNRDILKYTSRHHLLQQICHHLIQERLFSLVWCAEYLHEKGPIIPLSRCGLNPTIENSALCTDSTRYFSKLMLTAESILVINDLQSGSDAPLWQAAAQRFHCHSCVMFMVGKPPASCYLFYCFHPVIDYFDGNRIKYIQDLIAEVSNSMAIVDEHRHRLHAEAMARRREKVLESVFIAIPDLFFMMDLNGCILDYRASEAGLLYTPPDQFIGKKFREVLPPELGERLWAKVQEAIDTEKLVSLEYELQVPDGCRFFEARINRLKGEELLVSIVRDITQRKEKEHLIRKLYLAVEQSPVSVAITDIHANIEYVNQTFESTTGYSRAEVLGKNPRILQSGQTPVDVYREMWQLLLNGKVWRGVLANQKKSGELFWEQTTIAPVFDEQNNIANFLAVKEDITEKKRQQEYILHQAHYDALTDLPNRFLVLDRLSQLIGDASRQHRLMGILFLDLDDFKKVNDTLGHESGDLLLIEASRRLKCAVRGGDTVGRFGGDEFIILLNGLNHATDVRPVVDNLLRQFQIPFHIHDRDLMMTTSIGISLYPADGCDPSQLLRNADSAMYSAKQKGRNTYSFFTHSMNREMERRLLLEEQIHGALERQEFSLQYQPQVRLSDGKVIACETLLRWKNPALGLVSPDEFIPIAEYSGLIIPLGEYVLHQSLVFVAQVQRAFVPDFRIAVNLSPRQFRAPKLVESILSVVEAQKLKAGSLELEITEGILMSSHSLVGNALNELHQLGFGLAMDDFGTGYSSLSYLRSFPFNILKIDQSFISEVTFNADDRELVTAIIAMAHGLGLKVVAEGVESEQQFKLLRELNCDYAQGYWFSAPINRTQMFRYLHRQQLNFNNATK